MKVLTELSPYMLGFFAINILLILTQRQQIYHPRSYHSGYNTAFNQIKTIHYSVNNKKQAAYLYQKGNGPIEKIWIVLGGNASLALDWLHLLQHYPEQNQAFLLIDYPGYGNNTGYPSEKNNHQAVVQAYQAFLDNTNAKPSCYILGHSLGTAVAVNIAKILQPKAIVLLSPFTSTYDMSKNIIGHYWAWLLQSFIWDPYKTKETLIGLKRTHPDIKVYLLHGNQDSVVPVSMSREIHTKLKGWAHYQELSNKDHDLPYTAEKEILQTLQTASKTGH